MPRLMLLRPPSLAATGLLGWFKLFYLPSPKARLSHRVMKHKLTRATEGCHKSLFPFPMGQPCPHHPTAAHLGPYCRHKVECHSCLGPRPDGATFSRANSSFQPGLQQERFQKGSPVSQSSRQWFRVWDLESIRGLLVEAHRELQAGQLGPAASQAQQCTRNPRACVRPEVGCAPCAGQCVSLLPVLSPLASATLEKVMM